MSTTMDARKKSGPFLPKWQKVKGRHKALSGNLFKPDILAAINRYDQALKAYDERFKSHGNLRGVIKDMLAANKEAFDKIAKLNADITQLATKMKSATNAPGDTLYRYANGGNLDTSAIKSALTGIITAAEDYISKRKQAFADIDSTAQGNLNRVKKCLADYTGQAGGADSEMTRVENEANSAASTIMATLQTYIGIAEDADHPLIVKDLKTLKV